MAITYDPATCRIYIPDGSEATPIRFADILAADVAGGWGVFLQPYAGVNYYTCAAYLYINGGWLYTTQETLAFIDAAVMTGSYNISATKVAGAGGGITIGKKVTSGGVSWGEEGRTILYLGTLTGPRFECRGTKALFYNAVVRSHADAIDAFIFYGYADLVESYNSKFNVFRADSTCLTCIIRNTQVGNYCNHVSQWRMVADIDNLVIAGKGGYGASIWVNDIVFRNPVVRVTGYGFGTWVHGVTRIVNPDIVATISQYVNLYDDTVMQEQFYWQPAVGYNVAGVFTPQAGVTLTLVDGQGTTLYTGVSDANGQYDFTAITGSGNCNPDTTIAELTYRTVSGTSETVDDTYKNHVAIFSGAGFPTLVHPLAMDKPRLNDEIVLVPYTTPAIPTITTPEQTIGVPLILVEGTATDAEDIRVEVQVGGVTKAKVDQEGGAWAAWIPLVNGPNQVRARETNEEGTAGSWTVEKTYTAKIVHPTGIRVTPEGQISTVKEGKSIKVVR